MHINDMIMDRLVVVKIDATLWGGRKKLSPEDLILADGSVLPPSDLASLGSKRIADPRDLLIFSRLKREAERLCLQEGTRFLGGYAIPESALSRIEAHLNHIRATFEQAKVAFIQRYDSAIDDWIACHPAFREVIQRATESVDVVAQQLDFDYVVFRIKSTGSVTDESLHQRIAALTYNLLNDVGKVAEALALDSLSGKSRVTRKVLNPLRRIRAKLAGLSFMDPLITEKVDRLDDVLERAPRRGDLDGAYLDEVLQMTLWLADPLGSAVKTTATHETTQPFNFQNPERDLDRETATGLVEQGDALFGSLEREGTEPCLAEHGPSYWF